MLIHYVSSRKTSTDKMNRVELFDFAVQEMIARQEALKRYNDSGATVINTGNKHRSDFRLQIVLEKLCYRSHGLSKRQINQQEMLAIDDGAHQDELQSAWI